MKTIFKITGIELLEYPSESGHVKLTIIFQSNGDNHVTKSDKGIFDTVQASATYTRHIHNPEPEVLKTFIDAFYTKKSFYSDFTEAI
jgi:hypothetical protein